MKQTLIQREKREDLQVSGLDRNGGRNNGGLRVRIDVFAPSCKGMKLEEISSRFIIRLYFLKTNRNSTRGSYPPIVFDIIFDFLFTIF